MVLTYVSGPVLTDEALKLLKINKDGSASTLQKTGSGSTESTGSEKSYQPAFTKEQFLEFIVFLNHDLRWMAVIAVASVFLFYQDTFQYFFHYNMQENVQLEVLLYTCHILMIIDVTSIVMHIYNKNIARRQHFRPHGKVLMTLEIAALFGIMEDIVYLRNYLNFVALLAIFFSFFKLYRVFRFYYAVSTTAGTNDVKMLTLKYGLVFFIILNTCGSVWIYLACYDCPDKAGKEWSQQIPFKGIDANSSAWDWYAICMYFVSGSLTGNGFGDVRAISVFEQLFAMVIMTLGFFFVTTFIGSWSTVQEQGMRKHAWYSERLALIKKYINQAHVTKTLKKKIVDYYIVFWVQHGGMKSSYFLNFLPKSINSQIHLDCYWYALCQSYLMRDLHESIRRAIACAMYTEVYMQGEVVFTQGKQKNKMVFISRGAVHIISAKDRESPILTLGVGTLLGESSLVYSHKSPVNVVASTFCIAHILEKRAFWKIISKFRQLKPGAVIKKKMQAKMENALRSHSQDDDSQQLYTGTRLQIVKMNLKMEEPKKPNNYLYDFSDDALDRIFSGSKYSDLYILSKQETVLKHSDEIFLNTSWPWILQPQSIFLKCWEMIVVMAIVIVIILYPYQYSFHRRYFSFMPLVSIVVDTIYWSDIIIQVFTAVEDEHILISSISEIFKIRLKDIKFLVDIFSVVPLETFVKFMNITQNERYLTLLVSNRMVKIYKVVLFVRHLGTSFTVNVTVFRFVKNSLYLSFVSYFLGSLYYMLACFFEPCKPVTWITTLKEEDLAHGSNRTQYIFEFTLYYTMLLICSCGLGDVKSTNKIELKLMTIYFIVGFLIFAYLVSGYSATLSSKSYLEALFMERVDVMRKLIDDNQMPSNIENRMNEYFRLQWLHTHGYYITLDNSLMFDAPQHLYEQVKMAAYSRALSSVPLFQELGDEVIKMIAVKTTKILLQSNEIVVYAGDITSEMYIIYNGYVELISESTSRREKVLGPGDHFSSFDMILGQPHLYYVRTITDTILATVPLNSIKYIFQRHLNYSELEMLIKETNSSLAMQRLFVRKKDVMRHSFPEKRRFSWFVFPLNRLDPLYYDYENGFSRKGVFWTICKFFLMRRTANPEGNFIMIWEIFRVIFAFLTAMLYPPFSIFHNYYPKLVYVMFLLDLTGVADLYVRMHVGYYNENGVLVTHPRYTMTNYLKRAFMVDLFSLLPMSHIMHMFYNVENLATFYRVQSLVNFNKLLQMYRLPDAFSWFLRDGLTQETVFLNILKFMPILLVICNFLSCLLIVMTCEIKLVDRNVEISVGKGSWLWHKIDDYKFNVSTPLNMYVCAYYVTSSIFTTAAMGDITAWYKSEMFFMMFTVTAGYLLITYYQVIFTSAEASFNINLTLYQEHMKHLIKYMKRENVDYNLQAKAIDHFEYVWVRTHGLKGHEILNKCHITLRQDASLFLYENTLEKVPVFIDMSRSFYGLIATNVREQYFLHDTPIIKLNDIVDTFYIIHKGEVVVRGPDSSVFTTLQKGCVFGNMDNIHSTRSMISIISSTAIDLLTIKTSHLYQLLKDYPVVIHRLHRHILLENLSYMNSIHEKMEVINENYSSEKNVKKRRSITDFFLSKKFDLLTMIFSLCTCIVTSYHVAVQDHSVWIFLVIYFLDIYHVFYLVTKFFIPITTKTGDLLVTPKAISKTILRSFHFYADLLAVVPFEIFSPIASPQNRFYAFTWLRMNRMLRYMNMNNYFTVTLDHLNVNVMMLKIGFLLINFLLLAHISACIILLVGCFKGVCDKHSWTHDYKENLVCQHNVYVCSLYFMVALCTTVCYGDFLPKTIPELMTITILLILIKFFFMVICGNSSAMVANYYCSFLNYDFNIMTLKEYLEKTAVSKPLIDRVLNYVTWMWHKSEGYQVPMFLSKAPKLLKEDLKLDAYGRHLTLNSVFKNCHSDFLRILAGELELQTFFTGDIICHQCDVNETLYFIHKGVVEVLFMTDTDENLVDVLHENDSFGLIQGLYENTPHTHTFRAIAVTEVVFLDFKKWSYLLQFYPATKNEIYTRIRDL